ncbi:uncharacterized protein LOC122936026 isoform X2 [Bufo gargarizans]|uniref:uncharacterized protein LOC122936026 isoform X2 n=1 Tax=Bufo gargarizans TaxID=30331 RepID=UPI001CF54236|nr:uncharacterized protein LOC122936026 isoform X2 [Bufo gargarizans]
MIFCSSITTFNNTDSASKYMDFRKRDKTWATHLGSIFGESAAAGAESSNIKDLKLKIKDLLKKRIKIWWNKASLEQYLQKEIIPRGLRLQFFPAFEVDDPSFVGKWEDTLTRCSRTLIKLLIGADRKSLETIEKEIDNIREQIQRAVPVEACESFDSELEEDLVRWEKEIQGLKVKKFQRDLVDFQNYKVYRWHMTRSRTRNISLSLSTSSTNSQGCGESFLDERRGSSEGGGDENWTSRLRTPSTKRKTRQNYSVGKRVKKY